MNAYLNYLLEANLGLCLFLLMYHVFLKNETDFRLNRLFMLAGIIASVVFPLLHVNMENEILTIGNFIPATWLPEITILADGTIANPGAETSPIYILWLLIDGVYLTGLAVCLILLVIRLIQLFKKISHSKNHHRLGAYRIIESPEHKSSFSFFNFIFIGQSDQLTDVDKNQIVTHEAVHAQQLHSVDILLLQVLQVFFWFNPAIKIYKKIFVQLHEFEADARAVANRDVNDYCTLVAKVALLSADIQLANHFSNSLTLKRIEMMRTIKTKIKRWKIIAFAAMLPLFFFFVACQDQVLTEVTEIAKNSTMTLDHPPAVQAELNRLKKENPGHNYIVVVPDETAADQAVNLQKKLAVYDPASVKAMHILKDIADGDGVKRSYVILDYNDQIKQVAENAAGDDKIFMVVEEMATYPGGLDALRTFISENLSYPQEARMKGLEGSVLVSFVIGLDGKLSDFQVVKGVGEVLDKEAIKVVQKMEAWNPGKQSGKVVKTRFVLPINFKLNN